MSRKPLLSALAALLVVGVAGAVFAVERARYLGALEAEWASIVTSPGDDAARAARFDQFLVAFPPGHLFGNTHAAEAGRLSTQAHQRLADQAAQEEAAERARRADEEAVAAAARDEEEARARAKAAAEPLKEQVLAVLAGQLMDRLADARDLERGAVLLHLVHRGVHQVSYGVVELGPNPTFYGLRLLEPAAVNEALGSPVYDEAAKRVDPEALRTFLAAAWVAPDDPLLGTTAKAIYPAFQRRVRNELRLARGVLRELGPRLVELEREFVGKRKGVDRRLFYAHLFDLADQLRKFGIAPCELRDLDLGFWVRRIEDGTAPMLAEFLEQLVAAYDAAWLAELPDEPTPFTAKSGWLGGEQVGIEWQGSRWVTSQAGEPPEEGSDACDSEQRFFADPPEPAAAGVLTDAETGDRLVPRAALGRLSSSGSNGLLAFTADSEQLVVGAYDHLWWIDQGSLKEVRGAPLSRGNGRGPRLIAGRGVLVRPVSEGFTEVIDATTGAVVERLAGFVADDFDATGTVLARLDKGKPARLELRFRGDAGVELDGGLATIALSKQRFEAVKLLPSGDVVYAYQTTGTGADTTGWKAWDVATGARRSGLDVRNAFTVDPAGARLCHLDPAGKQEVLVELRDPVKGKWTPVPGKRWPGVDCRWLSASRLLVSAQPSPTVRSVRVVDVESGATIGRPVRIPNWSMDHSFVDASPDGSWLLLKDGNRRELLFWSLL